MTIIARGDVNDDGIEDLLMEFQDSICRNCLSLGSLVLTRLQHEKIFRIIDTSGSISFTCPKTFGVQFPNCSGQKIDAIRSQAVELSKTSYQSAFNLLEKFKNQCQRPYPGMKMAWLLNDMALFAAKNGDSSNCEKLVGDAKTSADLIYFDKLKSAIEFNQSICTQFVLK